MSSSFQKGNVNIETNTRHSGGEIRLVGCQGKQLISKFKFSRTVRIPRYDSKMSIELQEAKTELGGF